MNIGPPQVSYLTERGGPGLSCDEDGLALGAVALVSVSRDEEGAYCEVQSQVAMGDIVRAAYGQQSDASILSLHRGLVRAAACFERGEPERAGIEAASLGLPALAPEAMAKLARIAADPDPATIPYELWSEEFRLPADVTALGQAGLLALVVELLGEEVGSDAVDQINEVVARIGLDLGRGRLCLVDAQPARPDERAAKRPGARRSRSGRVAQRA
jgi:hypothetical protein